MNCQVLTIEQSSGILLPLHTDRGLSNSLEEDGGINLAKRFNGVSQIFACSPNRKTEEPQ